MSMYIPINTTVELETATSEIDVWGNPIPGSVTTIGANLRSQSGVVKDANGADQVYSYTLLFPGMVDISHEDTIRFDEANGDKIESRPLTVKFIRNISGKVEFTKAVF